MLNIVFKKTKEGTKRIMTIYNRNLPYCDMCGDQVDIREFDKTHLGERFCESCWTQFLLDELENSYIPEHLAELLKKVEEEL